MDNSVLTRQNWIDLCLAVTDVSDEVFFMRKNVGAQNCAHAEHSRATSLASAHLVTELSYRPESRNTFQVSKLQYPQYPFFHMVLPS